MQYEAIRSGRERRSADDRRTTRMQLFPDRRDGTERRSMSDRRRDS